MNAVGTKCGICIDYTLAAIDIAYFYTCRNLLRQPIHLNWDNELHHMFYFVIWNMGSFTIEVPLEKMTLQPCFNYWSLLWFWNTVPLPQYLSGLGLPIEVLKKMLESTIFSQPYSNLWWFCWNVLSHLGFFKLCGIKNTKQVKLSLFFKHKSQNMDSFFWNLEDSENLSQSHWLQPLKHKQT